MFLKQHGRVCAAAASIFLLGTSVSYAQFNPFSSARRGQSLNNTDVNMLFETAKELNDAQAVHIGDAKGWSNPDSGNSGTVKIVRLFKSGSLDCHSLRYDLAYKDKTSRTYTADWCRTDAGWKIKN
jgi:surface antigen